MQRRRSGLPIYDSDIYAAAVRAEKPAEFDFFASLPLPSVSSDWRQLTTANAARLLAGVDGVGTNEAVGRARS